MTPANSPVRRPAAVPHRPHAGTGPVNGCCGAIGVHYDGCFKAFRNVMIAVNGASKQPSAPPRRGAAPAPCRHRAHHRLLWKRFVRTMMAVSQYSKKS